MKNKINQLLIAILVLSFASCSKDDSPIPEVKPSPSISSQKFPKLSLEKPSVEMEVGKSTEVNIKSGGGAYHVFSANPSIATVGLKDSTLTLHALSLGDTSMIISDKNNQYTTLEVKTFYAQIALDKKEITIKELLGWQKKDTIRIVQGNPSYQVKSENEQVATVEIDDNLLIVTAQAEGQTKVDITDSRGLKAAVSIKIEDTTDPYTSQELDKIKADDTVRYFYLDKNIVKYYRSTPTSIRKFDDSLQKYQYGLSWYNGYYFFYLYFPGDKSVGKKQGSKIYYKLNYRSKPYSKDINFEIIKNDGTKFLAVYSFIEQGVLNYGYFCDSIN